MTGTWRTSFATASKNPIEPNKKLKKNILYLSPYFWPEEIGSAPYSTELARWLCNHGYAVDAVAFRPHYPDPAQFEPWAGGSRDTEIYEGISIQRVAVKGRGKGGFGNRILNDLSYLWRIIRLAFSGMRDRPYAVIVYVPGVLATYGAWLIARWYKARLVVVVHDIESGLARSVGLTSNRLVLALMRLVERIAFNRADRLVVLTAGMKTEIEQIGCRRPINVLPIWAVLPPVAPVPHDGPVRIMYSGNFGKKQGLPQLIPLFQRLQSGGYGIEVIMQGDGSERVAFQTQAAAAGITDIRYLPLAPAEEFVASLQSVHIHLVPQALNVANYALPSKLFSIMSAGRPFVCIAEKDSPLDVLARESGAGICVQPGEVESLYRKILDIAADYELQTRMGESGRKFVDRHMNKQNIMQTYEAIIRGDAGADDGAKENDA